MKTTRRASDRYWKLFRSFPLRPIRDDAENAEAMEIEVSSATGIAESSLSDMLSGKRKMSTRHVQLRARYFGVSTSTILGD